MKRILLSALFVSIFACCNNSTSTVSTSVGSSPVLSEAPPKGKIELTGGMNVEYEYLFNRNAIRDFVVEGSTVLALTESGNLLLFKLPYLELVSERCDTAGAFMLMRDTARRVCVCFENGRVARVDLNDLSLTEVAAPNKPIEWAGYNSQGRLWMLLKGKPLRLYDHDSKQTWPAAERRGVLPIVEGTRHAFLDSHDRFWVGTDAGEWGGGVELFDGRTEQWCESHDSSGVYGFFEAPYGETLIYGGIAHMGLNEGYIAKLANNELKTIGETKQVYRDGKWRYGGFGVVSDMLHNPFTNEFFLLSFSRLFQKQRDEWIPRHWFEIRYNFGRPDAVGCYPAISQAEFISADKLLISTVRDGFILLTFDNERSFARPRQVDTDCFESMISAGAEMWLVPCGRDAHELHRWHQGELDFVDLLPNMWVPCEEDEYNEFVVIQQIGDMEPRWAEWYQWQVLIALDGRMLALAGTNSFPGQQVLIGRVGGQMTVLKCWEGFQSLAFDDCFSTPDGRIWGESIPGIEDITGRKQLEVEGPMPVHSWWTQVLNADGPPWCVYYKGSGDKEPISHVLRLEPNDDESTATSTLLFEGEDIQAVCYMEKGTLLIAKVDKLELWRDGETSPFVVPGLDVKALNPQSLMRAEDGTLWIGGDDLVMVQGDKVRSFSDVPPLKGSRVTRIARHKADGSIWVALSHRGVVRLNLDEAE